MEENKKDELLAQGGEASENMAQADGTSDTVQSGGTVEGTDVPENTQGGESSADTHGQTSGEAQPSEAGATGEVCLHCGAAWTPGQAFCANCGAPKADPAPVSEASADATAPTCPNCGTLLQEGQKFCPGCGQMLGAADPAGSFNTGNRGFGDPRACILGYICIGGDLMCARKLCQGL